MVEILLAFISSIEYLELVATNDELRETLFRFVYTKLENSAREAISRNAATIEEIKMH